MSEAVLEEKKFVKCRVRISMKPIEFKDTYFKIPTKTQILDNLADCILRGELDEQFEIVTSQRGMRRGC